MSAHETQNARLYDYLEGVLSAEERQEFEQHMQACQLCREEVRMVNRLDEVVATLPQPELPARFFERLQAGLDEIDANPKVNGKLVPQATEAPTAVQGRQARPAPRRAWLMPALAAAACLILAVGLFWPSAPTALPALPPSDAGGSAAAAALRVVLASSDGGVRVAGGAVATTQVLPVGTLLESVQRSVLVVGQGNEVRLDTASQLKIEADGLHLTLGRVFVAERTQSVRIETAQGVIQPLGTDYDVNCDGQQTVVRVWDGQVRVQPRDGPVETLTPGQQLTLSSGHRSVTASTPDTWSQWNIKLPVQPSAPPLGSPLPRPPAVSLVVPTVNYPRARHRPPAPDFGSRPPVNRIPSVPSAVRDPSRVRPLPTPISTPISPPPLALARPPVPVARPDPLPQGQTYGPAPASYRPGNTAVADPRLPQGPNYPVYQPGTIQHEAQPMQQARYPAAQVPGGPGNDQMPGGPRPGGPMPGGQGPGAPGRGGQMPGGQMPGGQVPGGPGRGGQMPGGPGYEPGRGGQMPDGQGYGPPGRGEQMPGGPGRGGQMPRGPGYEPGRQGYESGPGGGPGGQMPGGPNSGQTTPGGGYRQGSWTPPAGGRSSGARR